VKTYSSHTSGEEKDCPHEKTNLSFYLAFKSTADLNQAHAH